MPSEIEIKLKVESLDSIRNQLVSLSARRIGPSKENNIFFDRPDRSLLAADKGLRVRLETSEANPEITALITFKGPRRKSAMHNRESFDLKVTPQQDAVGFLEALGFQRTLSFEKRRESWLLDDCHVELDELPFLGTFVEIEGPSESAVSAVQRKLNLENLPAVQPTYIAMVDQYIRDHHLATSELKFP